MKLLKEKIRGCTKCKEAFRVPLPGYFPDEDADVLIIGQNPGSAVNNEFDKQIFDKNTPLESFNDIYLEALKRSVMWKFFKRIFESYDFTIGYTNIVKCSTKNNEFPSDEMAANCFPYTEELIKKLKPKVIILHGSLPVKTFLKGKNLSETNLKLITSESRIFLPTYHYAFLLRKNYDMDQYIDILLEKIGEGLKLANDKSLNRFFRREE